MAKQPQRPTVGPKGQLPGARAKTPAQQRQERLERDHEVEHRSDSPGPEIVAQHNQEQDRRELTRTAVGLLQCEHLKDTEVFAAAGAYLAAQFKKDTIAPQPAPQPTEQPHEPDPKDEHETGGEG